MANNTLNTRIVICNDTTANWGTSQKVILKGEYAIEFPKNGEPKVKIGNGVDTFTNLPYITNTPTEITNAINSAVNAAKHTHSNKAILDAITASFTTGLKSNYDAAFNHSKAAHAPSNAQANVIETVKVNGAALTPNAKAVDITVPTKTSQLTNDKGFITSYKDTTYKLGTPASATNGNATLDLTNNLDSSKQSIVVKGAGATKVTTDANGAIIITSSDTDTKYSHPNSGVSAGTYKSVTVNAQGHVTAGSNPTTLAGFGISDAYTKSQTDSKISSAVANAGHLKRSIVSALPEVAKADEHTIYMVAKAAGAVGSGDYNGYDEYMLVISGDTKKFEKIGDSTVDLTNYATKAYADQSEADALSAAKTYANGLAKNYATAAQGTKADSAVQSVKIGATEYKSGTTVTLPSYPTTLPASDVKAWAKAATKPTYTKVEVGLGNVDNTADANKSVKYATSAGSANAVAWGNVTGKPSTYTPSSHNHNIEGLTNFSAHVYDATVSRTANTILAAPNGSNGTASFRKLVASDLPSHTHNYAGSSSAGGSANSAVKLATARSVSNTEDFVMSFSYDGSANSNASLRYYNSRISIGNTNNYPYHRFAKIDTQTSSYIDKTSTFLITQDYNGGGWGIVRISLRTNNSSSVSTVEAKWLVRCGLDVDCIQIGLYNVFGKTYADAFFKTSGTYTGTVIRNLASGARGNISRTWILTDSAEANSTTTSDKKTSTESYASTSAAATTLHSQAYTSIVVASDGGTVSYANSAGNASKVNNHTVNSNVPSGAKFTDTVYSHPTTSGNKHIPSGGSSGQILRWSSDGTAVWGNDNNTTYTLSSITGTLAVSKGGTGSTTAAGGRSNLGAVGFVYQSAEPSGQNNGDLWFKEE